MSHGPWAMSDEHWGEGHKPLPPARSFPAQLVAGGGTKSKFQGDRVWEGWKMQPAMAGMMRQAPKPGLIRGPSRRLWRSNVEVIGCMLSAGRG